MSGFNSRQKAGGPNSYGPFLHSSLHCYFQTLVVLEEVVGMLETLRDTTAYDLHRISPEAQAILRTIEELGHPMNEQTIHLVTTQQASSGWPVKVSTSWFTCKVKLSIINLDSGSRQLTRHSIGWICLQAYCYIAWLWPQLKRSGYKIILRDKGQGQPKVREWREYLTQAELFIGQWSYPPTSTGGIWNNITNH